LNILALALLLTVAPVLASANGPTKGGSTQPASKGAAAASAQTVTLTIEPRYLRDQPDGNTITFEPDSDRRSSSYTRYHFARAPFLQAVGGTLPTVAFTAVVQIDKTSQANEGGIEGGSAPIGGFNITHHTARLLSTTGIATSPAATASRACTQQDGAPRTITFINNHGFPVEVLWMNAACEAKLIQAIPPGQRVTLNTFDGHVFRLRNAQSGEVRSTLTISAKGPDDVVIR